MSVIGKWGGGGGGGGGSTTAAGQVKRAFNAFVQSTTATGHFKTFDFAKTTYIESIEVIPLNANGQPDDNFGIGTQLDSLQINGVEQWFKNRTSGERVHSLSKYYGTAVACEKIYFNYNRTDGINGIRAVVRGYTLEDK